MASGGAPRGTLGVVVRAAQPYGAAETPEPRADGKALLGPRRRKFPVSGRGDSPLTRIVGGEYGVRALTGIEFDKGLAPHLEER